VLQRLRSRLNREEGFTLIELLVVILIIGILAAIAIPSFLNQRGKGEDASAKSAVKTTQTAIETFRTDNGTYDCGADAPTCVTALQLIEKQVPAVGTAKGTIKALTGDANGYTITVYGGDLREYTIQMTGGAVTRACAVPSGQSNRGGCPASNSW
jgi:type IV pilus assembly protein PilA